MAGRADPDARVAPRPARGLQLTGAALVAIGVFVALLAWSVLHATALVRLGVGLAVLGFLLLAAAAIWRRIRGAFRA